jgi:CBS domain-containing protein
MDRHKLHRLAIAEPEASLTPSSSFRLVGLVTQSSIVRFLADHRAALGPLAVATMAAFVSAAKPLVTVRSTATAREALQTIVAHKISGAPVLDDAGAVVACVSVADVRAVSAFSTTEQVAELLSKTVMEYLQLRPSKGAALTLRPDDALATALVVLAESGAHSVTIVDGDRKPLGVCTLTDIIAAVVAAM